MIKTLSEVPLDNVGNKVWKRQHEYVNKLNQQAQINAQMEKSDYISEHFTSFSKAKLLVSELLTSEIWRENVIPIMTKTDDFKPISTIPLYLSLYNEAVIVNLLETICYNCDVVESIGELCVDLVDYCYRTLSYLYGMNQADNGVKDEVKESNQTPRDLVEKYQRSTLIEYGAKCISILRYISEAGDSIPLDAHTRIIRKLNVPNLIVALLDDGCPWIRSDSFYQSGSWHKKENPLCPHEINMLLLLRQLLLSDEMSSYEFHQQNINSLNRVQKFLTPTVLAFCAPLADLAKVLSHIQMQPPESTKPFALLIESEPEIKEKILSRFGDKFGGIAKNAMQTWANPSHAEIQSEAKALAKTWELDRMEQFLNQVPKCEVCGSEAVSRCSTCKHTWYCRRQCQVENWKEHKKICALLTSNK